MHTVFFFLMYVKKPEPKSGRVREVPEMEFQIDFYPGLNCGAKKYPPSKKIRK